MEVFGLDAIADTTGVIAVPGTSNGRLAVKIPSKEQPVSINKRNLKPVTYLEEINGTGNCVIGPKNMFSSIGENVEVRILKKPTFRFQAELNAEEISVTEKQIEAYTDIMSGWKSFQSLSNSFGS